MRSLAIKFFFARNLPKSAKDVINLNQKSDKTFKDLLLQDTQNSIKSLGIDVPVAQRGDSRIPAGKESLEHLDSFELMEQRFEKVCTKLKITDPKEKHLIRQLTKEDFFLQKKLSEEQDKLDHEKVFKDRKAELHKVYKEFNKIALEPDDFHQESVPHFSKMEQEAQIDQLQYLTEKYNKERVIDPYLLQRARTTKNMELFIQKQLFDDSKDVERLSNHAITVSKIQTNQSCTVCHIFWHFLEKQDKTQQKILNYKLEKYAGYLSGQMCQRLGLKFAPDVRFHYSETNIDIKEITEEIDKNAEKIVQQDLIEKYKLGEIPSKISKKQFEKQVQDLHDQKMELQSKKAILPSKSKKRQSAEEKEIKKSKVKDINAADKFWSSL